MATKPTKPIKDTNRIGADVFLRDPDDATIQYKARTFNINYDTKEADIGLFPRRWGTFSELHLPAEYRITVPLSELSLEPLSGTKQEGFEDMLIQRGETPPPWMDNAGRVHQPGCEEPTAPAPQTVVGDDGVPEPEFGDGLKQAVGEVVKAAAADPAVQSLIDSAVTAPPELQPSGNMSIGLGALKPSTVVDKTSGKKPPLFARGEILAQFDAVVAEYAKLRKMLEAAL